MSGPPTFPVHVELLRFFLERRAAVVERIQDLLNAQRQPVEYLRDRALLSRSVEDAFYIGATETQARLRGQLTDAHRAGGFAPRDLPGLYNGLVDPGEMAVRAFHLWQQTRWPGRNGRVHYAQTLYNLYVVHQLQLLSMRVWDDGTSSTGERLRELQAVLDQLWATSPADQPVLLRDARWLIPLAQSPATEDLGPYFGVADRIDSLPAADRIAVHAANVCLAAGHLRSQTRYYALKNGVGLNDQTLLRTTRGSNALDFALLIRDLVPLLDAYERACQGGDGDTRRALADAICQGLSTDPDLFVDRVALLGAYATIEHLFAATDDDDRVALTAIGRHQRTLFEHYQIGIGRASAALLEDCARLRPVAGTCSPYGVLYGFASNLMEHMALKALQPDAVTRFSLEDVFVSDASANKLAWVDGWRKLPHLERDVAARFEYPQAFAEAIVDRLEQALRRRVSGNAGAGPPTGRLVVSSVDGEPADATTWLVPSTDESRVLSDRREGRLLVSCRTSGGWVAIPKAVLTDTLAAGRDVHAAGLPAEAAATVTLLCPDLVR